MDEQTATTYEMNTSVGQAARGTQDIAGNISGVAEAAESTTKGAGDSYGAAKELSRMANHLHEMLGQYKF